jgi:serine/threonine protein kinase
MIGKEVANYRILKELGRGGMGVVYKANQLSLGRMVAMKMLPEHLTRDPSFIKRFENEARAIAKLNHPNIVQIFDIGNDDQIYYYTMEFVEGPSLDEIIYKEGFLPVERAVNIIVQVAFALQYAHSRGIVHRDIKPSNIMIEKSGRVKVTDFGLALQERSTRLTVRGDIVGTPEYMSPEQTLGQTATLRSDIYSLGVVFYELVTGKIPFEAESALTVLNKIQTSEPEWPRSINPDIPEGVERAIRKMMARNPRERYGSCQEVIQDMRRLKTGQSISTRARRPVRLRLLAGGLAVVLLALLFSIIRSRPTPPPPELKQMIQQLASYQEELKGIRLHCEGGDATPLSNEFERTDKEILSLRKWLEDIRRQYESRNPPPGNWLEQTTPRVAVFEERLADIRQQCDQPRILSLEALLSRVNADFDSLEKQFVRVRQLCADGEVLPLRDEFGEAETRISGLEKQWNGILQKHERQDMLALDEFSLIGQKIVSLEKQLAGILREYSWMDVVVFKNGRKKRCEISGESLEKVSIRTTTGTAEIPRSEIKLLVYARDTEKQIAEILDAKGPQIRDEIRYFKNEMAALEQEPEPQPIHEETESPASGGAEEGTDEQPLPRRSLIPHVASIPVPLLEENWSVSTDCARGTMVLFDDGILSMSTNHKIGSSTCTAKVSTTGPTKGILDSIEILVEVKQLLSTETGHAASFLVTTFADGRSIEYRLFDSQAESFDAQALPTADGLRISRPELFILPNKGQHKLKLPISKDAGKLGPAQEVVNISFVHRHTGPTMGIFLFRCKAIYLNTV